MSSISPKAVGYVLATPARNERQGLPALLDTVAGQTLLPLRWVIVDDGSDDGSREWLASVADRYPFLEVLSAPEAADEYLGAHIARIKRWGLERAIAGARARGLEPACAGV